MNVINLWRAYPLPIPIRWLLFSGAIGAIWIVVSGAAAFWFTVGMAYFLVVTS